MAIYNKEFLPFHMALMIIDGFPICQRSVDARHGAYPSPAATALLSVKEGKLRIAVGVVMNEADIFSAVKTTLDDCKQTHLLSGEEILSFHRGREKERGRVIKVADERGFQAFSETEKESLLARIASYGKTGKLEEYKTG